MAGRPLRPATRRRLGRPSPHQQADRTRAHPPPPKLSNPHHATGAEYPVLAAVSNCYPRVKGRLLTRYSPVRHSCTPKGLTVRLACVKHAASVRPEPGSNSPLKIYRHRPKGRLSSTLMFDADKISITGLSLIKGISKLTERITPVNEHGIF